MIQFLECLLEVFLVRIQVIDLYQPKLRFHFYLTTKEFGIICTIAYGAAQEMNRRAGQGAGDPASGGQGNTLEILGTEKK